MTLENQRIVVMGGTSGIGLATARSARALGAEVIITGRDEQKLRGSLAELGDGANGSRVDAGERDQLERFVTGIGRLDHLVLALGGSAGGGPVASLDLGDLRAGFEGKFWPHVTALQVALPSIESTGSVTFVSAGSAGAPYAGAAGLAAINGALSAMVPALAVELKPTRVNAVAPGVVDTPWWGGLAEQDRKALFSQYGAAAPVARVGRPEDVAQAITSVVANGFITGTVLTVDGGLRFTAAA
jgi:NAD(P)-dependent dehydrogenase (short-subunit alcohol dehydrogenase family)